MFHTNEGIKLPSCAIGVLNTAFPPPIYEPAQSTTLYTSDAPLPLSLSCGSKHDTLLHVQLALNGTSARVPPFFGITDAQIAPLLSEKTKALWYQACEKKTFDYQMKKITKDLVMSVESDIMSATIPLFPEQVAKMTEWSDRQLIIRSSSDEDTFDGVNAGGNRSIGNVTANIYDLRWALSRVVGSYFRYRSLKNRSAFGDPFTRMPLCSALVMEQITEQASLDVDSPVASGVMMTHKPSWIPRHEGSLSHIVASWGFGGGIVSGKIPCDEWVLTEDQRYVQIRKKPYRSREGGALKLEVANPPALREAPSLSDEQLRLLQVTGEKIEAYFQQPMDVEFVIKADLLYIVQARSVQAPEITSPTFLDPETLPEAFPRFHCTTIVPATSQVVSLMGKHILFAQDLDEADRAFVPAFHKAVIVSALPKSSNTHAEINFSGQRPPIPCLAAQEAWEMCKDAVKESFVNICPQTGCVVVATTDLPARKGLFLHPANFPLSVDDRSHGLEGRSTHPLLQQVERLLRATPEALMDRTDEIGDKLMNVFTEISQRTVHSDHLDSIARRLTEASSHILAAMHTAARAQHPNLLSFHASMLRQLLGQTAQQVVGAHSVSGLERATHLPDSIVTFISSHQDSKVLRELALLADNAFDGTLQGKFLSFLEALECTEAQKADLLRQMQQFDAIGLLPIWFTAYFSNGRPNVDDLSNQQPESLEFFQKVIHFETRFGLLSEQVAKLGTTHELEASWDLLQEETKDFLQFCSDHPIRDTLQTLLMSKMVYDLIELWDSNIKIVKKSRVACEFALYKKRIDAFAQFALATTEHSVFDKEYSYQLKELLQRLQTADWGSSRYKSFSVQHWLIPISPTIMPIMNDDQLFTVIHQNLIQACGPSFSSNITELLPSSLAIAVKAFQARTPMAKRFSEDSGTFVSITANQMSVTIHVPLNYHSFVVTLQQKKGSEEVDCIAYWKGSDNAQESHIDFFQIFSAMTGICLRKFSILDADLRIEFSVADERQIKLLTDAIYRVNEMTMSSKNYLAALARLLHPQKIKGRTFRAVEAEIKETTYRLLDFLWEQFRATEKMPPFLESYFKYEGGEDYLMERGRFSEVTALVRDELEGRRPRSNCSKIFLTVVLETMSLEDQKELVWHSLIGNRPLEPYNIPEDFSDDILRRFILEAPEKALLYFREKPYRVEQCESLGEELKGLSEMQSPTYSELLALFS